MRLRTRLAALASIPALALGVGLATATAGSAATTNVSFSSSAGNSAHWSADHTALVFDMNNATAPKGQGGFGYAIAYLHNTPSTLPATAPTFAATGFAAGTPRLVIFMSNGDTVFGYPNGTFEINSSATYVDWVTVLSTEDSHTVSSVYVVADASQAVPYEATVTSLQYAGNTYVP